MTRALLDPELAPVIDLLPDMTLSADVLDIARSFRHQAPLSDRVARSEHTIPGTPPVPVRVHRPRDVGGALPCVFAIHGGGLVAGSYEMDDTILDSWCAALGVIGISVEYRLSPETPYPGPLHDCHRALLWTFDHADALGIDRERIGLHGISAGAGLAAGLALLVRDEQTVTLAFQALDSPMLNDRQQTASSQLDDLLVWNKASNEFGWRSYLGELYGTPSVPYTAAAARATDLAGLPPTFVAVGALDGFRDEAADYALRLNRAGVPAELHIYPGAPHGFQMVPDAAVTVQAWRDKSAWLERQLRQSRR